MPNFNIKIFKRVTFTPRMFPDHKPGKFNETSRVFFDTEEYRLAYMRLCEFISKISSMRIYYKIIFSSKLYSVNFFSTLKESFIIKLYLFTIKENIIRSGAHARIISPSENPHKTDEEREWGVI